MGRAGRAGSPQAQVQTLPGKQLTPHPPGIPAAWSRAGITLGGSGGSIDVTPNRDAQLEQHGGIQPNAHRGPSAEPGSGERWFWTLVQFRQRAGDLFNPGYEHTSSLQWLGFACPLSTGSERLSVRRNGFLVVAVGAYGGAQPSRGGDALLKTRKGFCRNPSLPLSLSPSAAMYKRVWFQRDWGILTLQPGPPLR